MTSHVTEFKGQGIDGPTTAFLQGLIDSRLGLGLTQEDMARKLGITQSMISKIERGARALGIAEYLIWMDAMECDPFGLLQAYAQDLERNRKRTMLAGATKGARPTTKPWRRIP